jgi:ubiquinone/menaquinone biosynthesis C-methylase UbiE
MNESGTQIVSALGINFIDPLLVISQLDINPGSIVADFGCGAGFFSIPLSQASGKEGMVYSLDVLPQALESVESKARLGGITNIITKRVNLEKLKGSCLGDEIADWVIMKDMLFQNKNKEVIVEEAYRVLKPGGKALIIEWNNKNLAVGPDKNIRISTEELMEMVKRKKFTVEKVVKAGNFHYGMVVTK